MPTAEYADLFDIDSNANGDPILVDPVSGDTMATWDRSEGAWVPSQLGAVANPVPGTSHFNSVSTDEVNSTTYCETATELETAISNASDGDEIVVLGDVGQVNNPLEVTATVTLRGNASDEFGVIQKANDAPLIKWAAPRSTIKWIRGVGLGSATGTTDGFVTDDSINNNATRVHVVDSAMNDMGRDGWHLERANLSYYERPKASTCGRHGMFVTTGGGGDNNACTVVGADFRTNGGDGFHKVDGYNWTIIGGYSAANSGDGWYDDDDDSKYFGVGGEGNGDNMFHFGPNSDRGYAWISFDSSYLDEGDNVVERTTQGGKRIDGAMNILGALEITGASVLLNNNQSLDIEDTSGVRRELVRLTASDIARTGRREIPHRMEGAGEDLTSASGFANRTLAFHDGTGTPPEDLYWWDGPNSRWVRVGDASTTI